MTSTIASKPATKKRVRTKPIDWGRVVAYALLIVFAIIYLGPLLMLLNTSLKSLPEFMKNATAPATSFHLQNFADAWKKANFPRYMANTLLYTISATIIYVVAAVFVAFPIARNYVRGAKFLLTMFVIALFLPVALIPQFQLMLTLGLYNMTNKNYYPITRGMIVFQGVYGSNWPTLAAAVLIMTLPMLLNFLLLQRYIVSGLTSGAVKG